MVTRISSVTRRPRQPMMGFSARKTCISALSLSCWRAGSLETSGTWRRSSPGLARFAYTPLLPPMHTQVGLGVADGGMLAAINYAGYMSGALLAAWIESPVWRQRLYSWGLPLALVITALMGLSTQFGVWALSR